MIEAYVDATEIFLDVSTKLAGEEYCTASSVIPCLDEISVKLKELERTSPPGVKKKLAKTLYKFLVSDNPKRFKHDLYKTTAPYNFLTALDPR